MSNVLPWPMGWAWAPASTTHMNIPQKHTHTHTLLPTYQPSRTTTCKTHFLWCMWHILSVTQSDHSATWVCLKCHRDIRNSAYQHIHGTPGYEADLTTQWCAGKHLAINSPPFAQRIRQWEESHICHLALCERWLQPPR